MKTKVPDKEDHAFFNPSGAHYWMECSGFAAKKDEAPKQVPNEYMLEGTEAHKWIDRILAVKKGERKELLSKLKMHNSEMHFYIQEYLTFLELTKKKFFEGSSKYYEHHEHKTFFEKDNWGTLDYALIRLKTGRLEAIIIDFKYGKGVPRQATKDKQLINYLLGIDKRYGQTISKAWLYIYQPRTEGDPYSRYCIEKEEIKEWRKKFTSRLRILQEVREGKREEEYHAGEWCQFCPVNPICPQLKYTLKQEAFTQLDDISPTIPKLKSLTIEQRVNIFKHRKLFNKFLTSIAQDLQVRMQAGLTIKGLKLIHGRTNRRWKGNTAKIAEVLENYGLDPWDKSLISITQAERIVGKSLIGRMTFKPEGRLQVALAEDSRDNQAIEELPDLD